MDDTKPTYYADLNPNYDRHGRRSVGRFAVFLRKSKTESVQTLLQYSARKSAERAAEKLNAQEAESV